MANTIILKKSSVAGKAPAAGDLQVGELAVNLADAKLYSKDSGGTVIEVGGGGGASLPTQTGNSGKFLTTNGTAASWGDVAFSAVTSKPTSLAGYGITDAAPSSHVGSGGAEHAAATTSVAGFMSAADKSKLDGIAAGATANAGTVTSVGLSMPAQFSVSGSPVTTSGTLTAAWNSQTQNFVFAAPSSGNGVPTFRALVASDIPTLNQNTTGNAATATALQTARTIGGVSFNGTANINLPGVNTTGNQNTTGSAATLTTGRTIGMTGDVTWTSGSFNGSANVTGTATLANSGVTAGTYTKVTVDAKGRATSGTTLSESDIPDLTMAKLPSAAYKQSVRCATTANITLSGTQTIDGIAVVAGDRVLVKNQTTASQNGIYVVAAGAWARSADADNASEIGAAVVNVDSGTANGGELWTTTFRTTDTLGTTAMNWFEVLYNSGTWAISTTGSAATLTTARTINGTSFNGSANITTANWGTARTLSFTGDVTGSSSVNGSANVATAMTLANSGVTAGTYGSGTLIPVVTVDAKGRVTSATTAAVSGGAQAGGAIYENTQTISSNYTITSGRNGLSAGPITVASGVTVTIPSGSTWAIV